MLSSRYEWRSLSRLIAFALGGAMVVWMLWGMMGRMQRGAPGAERDQAVCYGNKLGTATAREKAIDQGYAIDRSLDCISRASYVAMQAREEAQKAEQRRRTIDEELAARREAERAAQASERQTLSDVRRTFITQVHVANPQPQPLPKPPRTLYERSDYTSGPYTLAAYVTPSPRDRVLHPAIIWLTGGDSNTLGDFWVRGPAGNDQSAQAFRDAGVVMMFPTLRGGNTNPGQRELGLGEVDDVISAAEHLAKLPYVDPRRIYLGGHSTGGTLALLVAQSTPRFAAVLALGPVGEMGDYGPSYARVDWRSLPPQELAVRSPGRWLDSIRSPTYLIEGQKPPGNLSSLTSMCQKAQAHPMVRCLSVPGHDHYSVVSAVARVAAAQIVVSKGEDFDLRVDQLTALPAPAPAAAPAASATPGGDAER